MTFLALFSILNILLRIPFNFFYLVGNFFVGITWESTENFILYKLKYKFAHRRDSIINSFMDIVFFVTGGLIAMFILLLDASFFFVSTIVFLFSSMILLDVYAIKTLKPIKNKKK